MPTVAHVAATPRSSNKEASCVTTPRLATSSAAGASRGPTWSRIPQCSSKSRDRTRAPDRLVMTTSRRQISHADQCRDAACPVTLRSGRATGRGRLGGERRREWAGAAGASDDDAGAAPPASGHILQPEWNGTDSLRERFDAVKPFLRASSLLDIGCASRYGRPDWLHGLLAQEITDLVGIDINEGTVAKLQAAGYDVRLADARDFDLHRQFDVVFAGELIEHLDDVRGFLTSVRRHLAPGGRLVLTTPNAFYVGNFVYRFGGRARVHPEHTCWYCEDTLRRVLGHQRIPVGGHALHRPRRAGHPPGAWRPTAPGTCCRPPRLRHHRRRGHARTGAGRAAAAGA